LWAAVEPRARELGAQDSDVSELRSKVRNLVIAAGWGDIAGNLAFVSDSDQKNCISAAMTLVDDETVPLVAKRVRSNRKIRVGYAASPTGGSAAISASTFAPVGAQTAALPDPVTPDTRCPRCASAMSTVGLANDGVGIYCSKDRIVLPLV
jgi:hypothetical protein